MSISDGNLLDFGIISKSEPQDTEPEIFTVDILTPAQSWQQGYRQCH